MQRVGKWVKFSFLAADDALSMRWLLRAAIMGVALPTLLHGSSTANAGVTVMPVSHFALIDPKADASNEQSEPIADAVSLNRPNNTGRKTSLLLRSSGKSAAAVTPLKRNRPMRETNPPKTRRRQLGW